MIATRYSQRAFRAGNAGDATVSLDRSTQRPRRRFESSLENVMSVFAAQAVDMKIKLRRLRKRAPEVFGQLNGEVSDHLPARLHFVNEKESPRKIDHRTAQGFVHRHKRFAVTIDARLVAECLDQRLAQRNRNVFN